MPDLSATPFCEYARGMAEDGDHLDDGIESGPAVPRPRDEGLVSLGEEHSETIEVRGERVGTRLASGTRVGRYIVIGAIPPVGIGDAYAAFDPQLDGKVILKLIGVSSIEETDAQVQALLESLEESLKIDHPSVAKVYEVGSFGDGVFVAMEFLEGINLRQWMEARDEPFPWTEVLRVFREAGRGLAAAHRYGVVHADFKPDNVFIVQRGRVCILDFGLTRLDPSGEFHDPLDRSALADDIAAIVDTGTLPDDALSVQGAPHYQAPEVLLGFSATAKSDQFAFCTSFYEVLFGERPYLADDPTALFVAQSRQSVRSVPSGSKVPEWLREVLLRGLRARPAERWSSMETLLATLDRDPSARRRRWATGAVVVGGLLLAAAGIGALALREARQCEPDESLLSGTWDSEVRSSLQRPFSASDKPYGARTWSTVQTRLDEWANEWLELRSVACTMTRIREEASRQLLEQRYACLDARLGEIDAFVSLYRDATPEMLDHAGAALYKIQLPRSCIAAPSLKTTALPPESLRERVLVLRHQEARAWVALHSGDEASARESADIVAQEVDHLEYPPLRVDNLLLRALLDERDAPADALDFLYEAAAIADSHDLQQLASQAWLGIARLEDEPKRAQLALKHAAFSVDEAHDGRLAAALIELQGDVAAANQQLGTALTSYREALAALDTASDPNPYAKARLLQNQGDLLAQRGDPTSAERYFERVLELITNLVGSEHPDLVPPLVGLGRVAEAREQLDDAYTFFERALDLIETQTTPDPALQAGVETSMAAIELSRGRVPNASARVDAALTRLREISPPPTVLADALAVSARVALSQGKPDVAQALLEQALTLESTAEFRELLALALWARGEPGLQSRALEFARTARSEYARAQSTNDVERVDTWLDEHGETAQPERE